VVSIGETVNPLKLAGNLLFAKPLEQRMTLINNRLKNFFMVIIKFKTVSGQNLANAKIDKIL